MAQGVRDNLLGREELFRLLVEGVRDYAIFLLDPQGRVVSWNEGAERIKGYAAEEILGQHFSRFYPAEALARDWPRHELAVARREGRFEDEGWRVRKDGSQFWANVVITALHDRTGTHVGYAKITRDLTERREVETLREGRRQTSEFLAMLGHELRNPLAPIRNAIAILRARETGDPTTAWAHGVIERQVTFLGRLVDDLLDVSRIATGKVTMQRAPLDLSDLVRHTVDGLRPSMAARQQTLELALPPQPVRVAGDGARLAQVATNLLTNASKYTPPGGHVWVSLDADDEICELRVRDDGIGMASHLVPRVFDLFTQGERALDRSEGGLGIGLTVVQKLVEMHGGSVAASSPGPGLGSEFCVRLPRLEDHASAAAKPAPATGELDWNPRVLVVDDNQDAAETVARLIEHWGGRVRVTHDGAGAVDILAAERMDVAFVDIGLPGLDGYGVARQVREAGQRLTLVAMTGYGQPEDRERALAAGFDEHVVKPAEPARLRQVLEQARRQASSPSS